MPTPWLLGTSGSSELGDTTWLTAGIPTQAPSYQVFIDLNNDIDFEDSLEEITDYVISMDFQIGMNPFDSMARLGTARIVLNNADKRFSPENTSSPYYDASTKTSLLPMRAVRITMDTGDDKTALWTGLLNMLDVIPGIEQERRAIMRCVDYNEFTTQRRIKEFGLQKNMLSSDGLIELLGRNVVAGNWLVGVSGKSELGITTILGGPRFDDIGQIQTGAETFERIGDTWYNEKVIIGKAIQDIVQSEGWPARFYFDRVGNPVFWNRQYMQSRTETPTTVTADTDVQGMGYDWGQRVYNRIIIKMTPRQADTNTEIIFTNRAESIKIGPGEKKNIRAMFVDEVGKRVGAQDLIVPERGTDFTINTERDGSGTDITSGITVGLQPRPEHAEIIFSSNRADIVYIINLQLRGRKLKHFDPSEIRAFDGESESLYGQRDLSIDAPLLNDPDIGLGLANLMLKMRSTPRSSVNQITLVDDGTAARRFQLENLTIGSLIRLSEGQTALSSADYTIVGQRHIINNSKEHTAIYRLEPRLPLEMWLLGVSGRSELGETTHLAL
jgi:hypothetical protein